MKRLVLATLLICSLMPASAFAGTIINLFPNDGSGGNFGFRTYGAGYSITGGGGIAASAFNDFPPGYAPGSTFGINTPIFFDFGFAQLGPISSDVQFTDGVLFVSSVTLPTNGQDFRAFVTVGFDASGIFLATATASLQVGVRRDTSIFPILMVVTIPVPLLRCRNRARWRSSVRECWGSLLARRTRLRASASVADKNRRL